MTYSRVLFPVVFALGIVFMFPLVAAAQPKVPHTLEGRSACTTCHQVGGSGVGTSGGTGLPTSHQGRTDATCSACHTAAAAAPAPTATAAPAAPKPTASPSPTTPPASTQPAASPTPSAASAAALPKSGGPSAVLLAVLATSLVGAGWVARRYTRPR